MFGSTSDGKLDAVLQEFGVERLPGVHCYEFFTGSATFRALVQAKAHAAYLGLQFEHHYTGLNRVADQLQEQFVRWQD